VFFLIKLVWWVVTLPIRLALFAVGVVFWVLTLPLRIVFGVLSFIGLTRLLQLGIVGAIGYVFYKLVNPDSEDLLPPGPLGSTLAGGAVGQSAPTAADLAKVPST
jgi:hypothetical protein